MLGEKEFASIIDEANAFLNGMMASNQIPSSPKLTPLRQAQHLIYEAWESPGKQRVELARRALEISSEIFKDLLKQPRVYKSKEMNWKGGPAKWGKNVINSQRTMVTQAIETHIDLLTATSHGQKNWTYEQRCILYPGRISYIQLTQKRVLIISFKFGKKGEKGELVHLVRIQNTETRIQNKFF